MIKNKLRNKFITKRKSISDFDRNICNEKIKNKILSNDKIREARCILAYLSMKAEVETSAIIKELIKLGKRVALPKVNKADNSMRCYFIRSVKKDTEIGAYGIREPHTDLLEANIQEIDLVIVPGVAFDRKGGRLGFGAGYYDRFLSRAYKAFKLALCYDVQIAKEELFQEKTDVMMDLIITDKEVINLN